MPELPDLEVFKHNIFKQLVSKTLESITVCNPTKVNTHESQLTQALANRELTAIHRYGKELLFDFGDGEIIASHLMLSGKIAIANTLQAVEAIPYKICILHFKDQSLVFSDMGGLCTIKYKPLRDRVPDAFGQDFTLDYFLNIAQKKPRANIKAFIIDQKVVKGIGNAYADEILWAAYISPHSTVGNIPENMMVQLYEAINTVLAQAVESIKALQPDIISGEERRFLQVHTKLKKQTATGFPIIIERIASKTTYYTQEQVLY